MPRASLEDAALGRLAHHLEEHGEAVEVRARPDRERRGGRAVDAEFLIDGRVVGVEITQVLPGARAHSEVARLERAVEQAVRSMVRQFPAGYVAVCVDFGPLPPASKLRAAEPALAQEIATCIDSLDPSPTDRHETPIDTSLRFVRRLSVLQLPRAPSGFGWITASDEFGGWIGPMADEFVEHLLATKPGQTNAYPEAWLVIVDRVGLVDATNVADALERRAANIPANWSRVWFLSATDASSVILVRSGPVPSTTTPVTATPDAPASTASRPRGN